MINSNYVCPICNEELFLENADIKCKKDPNHVFSLHNEIPRFTPSKNYAENFGFQWNKFQTTQLDKRNERNIDLSFERFFLQTGWDPSSLDHINILEVGSGAGRFSEVILKNTNANLYSFDFSNAVDANYENHRAFNDRFFLSQASIYNMPFKDDSFDKVFCFGVLQHTPNFRQSIKAIVNKTRSGGEIVVDFYSINGWWSKINAKYLLRPVTKRLPHRILLNIIKYMAPILILMSNILNRLKIGILTRFLPIVDIQGTLPKDLDSKELKEWVILDTFDMFSPEHDHPQKIADVRKMFEDFGCSVSLARHLQTKNGFKCNVVRARKK